VAIEAAVPPGTAAAPRISVLRLPGGRRLTVRSWPGSGDALVLLHGLLDCSEGWAWLAERSERPCLAVDLAGFGGSDLPARPAIEAYADDVVAALEALGVECCTVVGHSFGGAVAAAVAERSEAVRALVLLAPAGFGRIALAETFSRRLVADLATLALPLALMNPLAVTLGYATFVARGQLPDRALVDRLRSAAGRAAALAARAAMAAIADAGRAAAAAEHGTGRFAGPVAVLWGERDRVVPCTHADGVLAALPQAHVELWPGMGHHPQRERPRQLAHFVERHAHATPAAAPVLRLAA
jgi:pimeloyl-ACP methyl ester carboxylesterase